MNEFDDEFNTTNLAWTMFATNGNPGYYMLYRDLMREDEEKEI